MRVTVHCSAAAPADDVSNLALKCNPGEKKVWIEQGDGKNRKILFSSTFDAVLDASADAAGEAERLHDSALASAVASCIEGKLAVVLCIGSNASTRAALLHALCTHSVPSLIDAADKGGKALSVSALHAHWEVLTDLLSGAPVEQAPPTGSSAGLLGASSRSVEAADEAAGVLQALPAAASNIEMEAMGDAGGGHLAIQLQLGEGRLMVLQVAELGSLAGSDLLKSTLCHASHSSLHKALAKPASRPAAAELPLLTRLLSPVFDAGTSATVSSRLLLCVTPHATQETVDLLRVAQAAAGGKGAKSKKDKGAEAVEARQEAVIEMLQKMLVDGKEVPSAVKLEAEFRKAVGDGSGLESAMAAAAAELAEVKTALEAARTEGGAETAAQAAEAEVERQIAEWAAEEAALKKQLEAEQKEAKTLTEALYEHSSRQPEHADASRKGLSAAELKEQVDKYERAVETAWSDVQRAQKEAEETEARFDRAREVARRSAAEKEEMESTLLDVAADLENLARNYRQHGSPAMAVPLYVSALAIFEKTLGPEHPQVASNLVNLGNAFCDQQKHIDAVPVYLRALAIDEKALGHDHPEVAMDLSNLGIAYRALGRADIASGLFERAHKLMLAAVGPDDPKTQAILRNLG